MPEPTSPSVPVVPCCPMDGDPHHIMCPDHRRPPAPSRCGHPWSEHPTVNGEPYCEPSTCPAGAPDAVG